MRKLEEFVDELKKDSMENPVSRTGACIEIGVLYKESCVSIGDSLHESCLSLGKRDESCLALVDSFTESCMALG